MSCVALTGLTLLRGPELGALRWVIISRPLGAGEFLIAERWGEGSRGLQPTVRRRTTPASRSDATESHVLHRGFKPTATVGASLREAGGNS